MATSWLPRWLGGSSQASPEGAHQNAAGVSSPISELPEVATPVPVASHSLAPPGMHVLEVEPALITAPAAPAAAAAVAAQAGETPAGGTGGSNSGPADAATAEDFSDLDALGFLLTDVVDKAGRPVVVVVARRVSIRTLNVDRLRRYWLHKCSALVQRSGYSLVWMHTLATYRDNCPGLSWLWQTYERLPPEFRSHLSKVYVLHCDMSLWIAMASIAPWFSSDFWRKVEWVPRIEFLHDYIDKRRLAVPDFVAEHDEELEEHPLRDYGLLAMKLPGIPVTSQQG